MINATAKVFEQVNRKWLRDLTTINSFNDPVPSNSPHFALLMLLPSGKSIKNILSTLLLFTALCA